jgi:HSP20 family molecular chaperone IbpA
MSSNLPTKRKVSSFLTPRSIFSPFFRDFDFEDNLQDILSEFRGLMQWDERMGSCDFEKTKDEYIVSVDVPGLTKDDIKVEIDGNVMKISGERKPKEKVEGREYLASERTYRRFERSFALPEDVDTNKHDAKVENGVLTLTFGRKNTEDKPKTIEIK